MNDVTPATREEVAELLGEIDASYIDRVFDTGASVDEIGEAIDAIERVAPRATTSSIRVEQVRTVLGELFAPDSTALFPLRGVPIEPE